MDRLYTGKIEDYFKNRDFVHQIGFYAPDWKEFAKKHHELFGSGPFYYTTNTFGRLMYRGEEINCKGLELHAAYGGWGSHSVEVVQQIPADIPTMYTDHGNMETVSMNHLHMFVEDLGEAQEACYALGIPIVTIGWSDPANALRKAEETGANIEAVRASLEKSSFMVIDLTRDLGTMVQLITPRAKLLHDMIRKAAADWDGETDLFRRLG